MVKKTGEELMENTMTSGDDWSNPNADPKADMTVVIKNCHPLHRECVIEGFDPEGKVWSEEERKEMMEAPPRLDPDDFRPLEIHMPKDTADKLKEFLKDKTCSCGRGLYTVHEQKVKLCGRCTTEV